MSREEACFIYDGEIYYKIDASEIDIDYDLKRIVESSMYDDFDEGTYIVLKAQDYLIQRQTHLIIKKYCE